MEEEEKRFKSLEMRSKASVCEAPLNTVRDVKNKDTDEIWRIRQIGFKRKSKI